MVVLMTTNENNAGNNDNTDDSDISDNLNLIKYDTNTKDNHVIKGF